MLLYNNSKRTGKTVFLYYKKVLRTSYNINTLHRNLHKANFAREQRRGLKNVLISDNVINVRFCSIKKTIIKKDN